MLFRVILRQTVKEGCLTVTWADGSRETFGNGGEPRAAIRLTRRSLEWTLPLNPSLRLGEAYMEGTLILEEGDLESLLGVMLTNYDRLTRLPLVRAALALQRQGRRLQQYNPIGVAQRNVAHHYDLSRSLYDLFLDADRQYSCAYFEEPEMTLEAAQEAKKRHIAAKLLLDRPGLRLLDIGSGWGGLGLYLAQAGEAKVKGVTLSQEQLSLSRDRAQRAGLDGQVDFQLQDYRHEPGRYDRIVSVGMFEHVGKRNYDEFFAKTRDLLEEDGVFLLHSIGRFDEPSSINPFIRKYIFPGADVPALSEVTAAVERSGLFITDIEILRLHYAETLRHWFERFQANREKVRELYDERFCRMWEVYLKGCEIGFRQQDLMVFQMQLTRRLDAVPLTRDYIAAGERRLARPRAQSTAAE